MERVWESIVAIPTRTLGKRYGAEHSVDKQRVTHALAEYRRFLALKVLERDFDDRRIGAPTPVLKLWRLHVLDTHAYAAATSALCGCYIHHDPDADTDEARRRRRAHRALSAYRAHFSEAPPRDVWDFGEIGAPPRADEPEEEETPASKRARPSLLDVTVQAPGAEITTVSLRSDELGSELLSRYAELTGYRPTGAHELAVGAGGATPSVRLRCGKEWLHPSQPVGAAGLRAGSHVLVAVADRRRDPAQIAVTVNEAAGGERATVYVRPNAAVSELMDAIQNALGVLTEAQQLVFASAVLHPDQYVREIAPRCALVRPAARRPAPLARAARGQRRRGRLDRAAGHRQAATDRRRRDEPRRHVAHGPRQAAMSHCTLNARQPRGSGARARPAPVVRTPLPTPGGPRCDQDNARYLL